MIRAISVGNTSALPAGSPSGGVTIGAAAEITETDVKPQEMRRVFFTFGCVAPFLLGNIGQGEERRGAENG